MESPYEDKVLRAFANQLLRGYDHAPTCFCVHCNEERIRRIIDLKLEVIQGQEQIFLEAEAVARGCENKYPLTGKPDKDSAYKNGWYDASYHIRRVLRRLRAVRVEKLQ